MRFAEFTPGLMLLAGPRTVDGEEMIQFASRYDPQWFHLNAERAAASRWKGLIASGWHTCAIAMELMVSEFLHDSESFGSPGIDKLEWLEPVRPGDALTLKVEVLETRVSSSGRTGILRCRWELWNQGNRKVLSMIGISLFEIAPAVT